MIYFLYYLFFSFCLWFAFNVFVFGLPLFMPLCVLSLPLFMSFVSLCCLHLSNSDPLTQWIPLPTLLTKTFLNSHSFFLFFSCHLSVAQLHFSLLLCLTTSQQRKNYLIIFTNFALSIYLFYLYNARVTNTESQSQKAQKDRKSVV